MQFKRLWEEKIHWLLLIWCGVALYIRPGWIPFGLGVIAWGALFYLTTPARFWTMIASFNLDQDKVEAYLRKAIAYQPASPRPYINLALIKARRKQWEEGAALLGEADQKPGKRLSPELRNVLAVCHREAGHYDQAIALIETLLAENYANDKVYYNLAYTNYKTGCLDNALKAAEKARTYNLSDADPVLLIAKIYFEQQDYEAAKDNYEWCLQHTSWPVESYYWLGRCELELGQAEQARDHLATAVERITSDPELSDVPREEAQAWLDQAIALSAEPGPQATAENEPNPS
jgi:tetratricopeptide (TPR) repeat protein